MAVDKIRRKEMARIFAQLIRGEVWDEDYEGRKDKLFAGVKWSKNEVDDAIEEACIWGELLSCSYDPVKYSGDRALPFEFRQRLEELVCVLESDQEYTMRDPFKEVEYYNSLWPPYEIPQATVKDQFAGLFPKPHFEWISDVCSWWRGKKKNVTR